MVGIDEYYASHESEYEEDGENVRPVDHFAFEGRTEGTLTINILGRTAQRPLRIDWKHTPDWEHYDERYKRLLSDVLFTPNFMHSVYVWLDPSDSMFGVDPEGEEHEPAWKKIDVDVGEGFWGKEVDEAIE